MLYSKSPADRSDHDLYVKIIDPDDADAYNEFIIHSITTGDQGGNHNGSWGKPAMALTPGGGLVITYMGETSTGGSGIMQTFFSASDLYSLSSSAYDLVFDYHSELTSFEFSATDADGDILTFNNFPFETSFNASVTDNGDGTFSYFMPQEWETGTDTITISASDGAYEINETFDVLLVTDIA